MKKPIIAAALALFMACGSPAGTQTTQLPTGTLDQLLAPIALYPDQLLAQMLMSATDPTKVTELDKWLKSNAKLKGTPLQDAAVKAGFDASFVALVLFPQVVTYMAEQIAWTRVLGQAFESDKSAVFASIQKLRKQAQTVGTLKSTPQQEVETKTTSAGEQVIVIEPTNPQIVYVPQYNTEVVYTQAPTTTTVIIQEEDDDADEMIAAGLIGFTAGIAMGAAMDNHYYYGPYGFYGGAYMYNDAWDDYYDHREDAREDWMDHREDLVEDRSDRLEDQRENRTDRAENTQEQRTDRAENRQENRPDTQAQRAERTTQAQGASTQSASGSRAATAEARGRSSGAAAQPSSQRAGSDAFSGYSSGSSQRTPAPGGSKAAAAAPRAAAGHVAAAGVGAELRSERVPMNTTNRSDEVRRVIWRSLTVWCTCALMAAAMFSGRASAQAARQFASPEDAVKALITAAKAGRVADLVAILGAEGTDLVESSDPATARQHQKVFIVAVGEQWRLEDAVPNRKTLVIGNEDWPFPVPLVKEASGWRFDTAAGREELIARRIGRNELAAIATVRAYLTAQRLYAEQAHDGNPAGVYAAKFASDPGMENGLYWPTKAGQKRSPLGDLVAQAAAEGRAVGGDRSQPSPFHGYYFKILTAQGSAAPGGRKQYLVKGLMSGGFALIAWPAQYDVTGVMTLVVNQNGIVHEKDLGAGTDAAARKMTAYNPDKSWRQVQ